MITCFFGKNHLVAIWRLDHRRAKKELRSRGARLGCDVGERWCFLWSDGNLTGAPSLKASLNTHLN
jgi:hypothetical protein